MGHGNKKKKIGKKRYHKGQTGEQKRNKMGVEEEEQEEDEEEKKEGEEKEEEEEEKAVEDGRIGIY